MYYKEGMNLKCTKEKNEEEKIWDQYGRWAVGNGYGGGVRYGTYETYCKDTKKWSEFEPCERPEPEKEEIKERKRLKI